MSTSHDDAPLNQAAQEVKGNDSPQFGRLLIVLSIAVLTIIALTFAAEAYYTP